MTSPFYQLTIMWHIIVLIFCIILYNFITNYKKKKRSKPSAFKRSIITENTKEIRDLLDRSGYTPLPPLYGRTLYTSHIYKKYSTTSFPNDIENIYKERIACAPKISIIKKYI